MALQILVTISDHQQLWWSPDICSHIQSQWFLHWSWWEWVYRYPHILP